MWTRRERTISLIAYGGLMRSKGSEGKGKKEVLRRVRNETYEPVETTLITPTLSRANAPNPFRAFRPENQESPDELPR